MIVRQQTYIPILGSHAELCHFAVPIGNVTGIVGGLLDDGQGEEVGNVHAAHCICLSVLNRFGKLHETTPSVIPSHPGGDRVEEKGNEEGKKKTCLEGDVGGLMFECHGISLFDKDTQNKPVKIHLLLQIYVGSQAVMTTCVVLDPGLCASVFQRVCLYRTNNDKVPKK